MNQLGSLFTWIFIVLNFTAFSQCCLEYNNEWATHNTVATQRVAYLVIAAGQSNMQGTANNPSDYPQMGYEDCFFWNNNNDFLPLFPQNYQTGTEFVGCELSLLPAIRDFISDTVYLVKYARGGTGIAQNPSKVDWNVNSNQHLTTFINYVVSAKNHLLNVKNYDDVKLYFIWHQGEEDSKQLAWANAYSDNFLDIVQKVKDDTSSPNMRTYIGRVHDSYPTTIFPHYSIVRTQQDNLSVNIDGIVDTDTYGLNPDNIHYSPQGILDLGNDFFEVIFNDL